MKCSELSKLLNFANFIEIMKRSIGLLLIMQTGFPLAADNPVTLSAKSVSIDMQSPSADFSDSIVIHHGNMRITADTLAQLNNNQTKQEKMLLTGSPARIDFKQQDSQLNIHIEAAKISFFPNRGLLEISGNSKLTTMDDGELQTSIQAEQISVTLTTKKIETIKAQGSPLSYQFSPKQGEEIIATAQQLSLNQLTGDVDLHNATVNQGSNRLRAGQIQIDGETGNLSANSGGAARPSLSIEFDTEKLESKQQQLKEQQQ